MMSDAIEANTSKQSRILLIGGVVIADNICGSTAVAGHTCRISLRFKLEQNAALCTAFSFIGEMLLHYKKKFQTFDFRLSLHLFFCTLPQMNTFYFQPKP
jgi:hypothetical protein